MNEFIIPRPGDPDWPAWNARLQAGRQALQQGVLRDKELGISLRFIRAYDPATDFLFVPGRVNRPYPRDADEPKVTADVAAYLDDWFAK